MKFEVEKFLAQPTAKTKSDNKAEFLVNWKGMKTMTVSHSYVCRKLQNRSRSIGTELQCKQLSLNQAVALGWLPEAAGWLLSGSRGGGSPLLWIMECQGASASVAGIPVAYTASPRVVWMSMFVWHCDRQLPCLHFLQNAMLAPCYQSSDMLQSSSSISHFMLQYISQT